MGLIGTVLPIGSVGIGDEGSGDVVLGGGPDAVYIGTEDQSSYVIGRLTGPATASPPQPRYTRTERHELYSIVTWAGHDPFEMTVPIKFDRAATGGGVEADIRALFRLAGGGSNSKPIEPAIVRVVGTVPHAGLRWRISTIDEDRARTEYLPNSDRRSRFVCAVNLVQHVADELLESSLQKGKKAKGFRARTTKSRRGEDLYDISKRMYGDRSHAAEIARANGLGVSYRPMAGTPLRIP
jgi:hypothetical protein